MEKTSGRLMLSLVMIASVCLSCNTNDAVGPQEETYVPLITNSWTDVSRPDHKFNLVAQKDSVSQGTLTGEETFTDSTVSFPLKGVFSNRNISFTVTKRGIDSTYVGRFTADTLIDLGRLKLFRQNF